jgi:hypothetical protein
LLLLFFSIKSFAQVIPSLELGVITHTIDTLKGNVSVVDATLRGQMRWVLWEDKIGEINTSRLALFYNQKNKSKKVWETSWPETYQPKIDVFRQWIWHGNPVIAVFLQLGAGYQQIKLYGLDASNQPVRLDEKEATESSWGIANDKTVLVLYQASPVQLTPECYGWNQQAAKLVSKACK